MTHETNWQTFSAIAFLLSAQFVCYSAGAENSEVNLDAETRQLSTDDDTGLNPILRGRHQHAVLQRKRASSNSKKWIEITHTYSILEKEGLMQCMPSAD